MGVAVGVGVTVGVKVGRGVAVDLGVDTAVRGKVGGAVGVGVKGDRVGVAVAVSTAADRPRAAQPGYRQQAEQQQTEGTQGPPPTAGGKGNRHAPAPRQVRGDCELLRIVAQGAGRWARSESCGPNAHYILSSMPATSGGRTSNPMRGSTTPARSLRPRLTPYRPPANAAAPLSQVEGQPPSAGMPFMGSLRLGPWS